MAQSRYLLLLIQFLPALLLAQNFEGKWEGELTQDGKPDLYVYRLDLVQHDNRVSGTATSRKKSGGADAKFEIGGSWDGKSLTLQEVHQIEPEGARWCLKHIRLSYDGSKELKGSWEAEGCKPGWLKLIKDGPAPSPEPSAIVVESPPQNKLPGHWVGHLDQSDRDYGFFFELDLMEDGTGTSRITSDGEGGNAAQSLRWTFDESNNRLVIKELEVVERSVESWPWCIKSATLFYEEEANRLSLKGRWKGHIEGHNDGSGVCAPGKLYLERPVFRKEEITQESDLPEVKSTPVAVKKYEEKEGRDVKVDRVLEVNSKTIKVAVWDNGTVDGDILSLFVNGEMILENYRASSRKHVTIVKLDKPTNYLILHAINLGSITPNTVAVSVNDGVEEQVVIMSSNLRESGAVMLREFRVED